MERQEKAYWTLDAREPESERWSSLIDFTVEGLDGPWLVEPAYLRSAALRGKLELDRLESIYLGGPGFIARSVIGQETVTCWRPLFYRETQAVPAEGGIELRPTSDDWQLNPLFHDSLDKQMNIRPEVEPDVLNERVLKRARELVAAGAENPASALVDSLYEHIPELAGKLRFNPADTFASPPSTWTLFSPPSAAGVYTQQLVRDYTAMETLLAAESVQAARSTKGLDLLLQHKAPALKEHPEILPFVSLNAAQERAVAEMLGGRPVTVVSGPPGCGKSQVVVSLLLNAWAQGQSVLFASNNNKAVDVVRERLRQFDAVHPVSLRAGSKGNNLATALPRVSQAAGDEEQVTHDLDTLRSSRAKLREERTRIVQELDSGTPQRITEALAAALHEYGNYRRGHAEIGKRDAAMMQRLQEIAGYPCRPEDVGQTLEATRVWLATVAALQAENGKELSRRLRLVDEARHASAAAKAALARCGIERKESISQDEWQAFSDVLSKLNAWRTNAIAVLDDVNVSMLSPTAWSPRYNRWTTEEQASQAASQLLQLEAEVAVALAAASRSLTEKKDAVVREADAWKELEDIGWTARLRTKDVDIGVLNTWLVIWSRFITAPPGFLGLSAAFARRTMRKQLASCEAKLRESIPIEAWRTIGPLHDNARHRLEGVVERVIRHQDARRASVHAAGNCDVAAARLEQLRTSVRALGGPDVREVFDPVQWSPVTVFLQQGLREATDAAAAWRLRTQREGISEAIRGIGESWIDHMRSAPDLLPWLQGVGESLSTRVRDLARLQTTESARAAAMAMSDVELTALCDSLSSALAEDRRRYEAQTRHDAIPSESDRIGEAWASRPSMAIVVGPERSEWPNFDEHREKIHELEAWSVEWLPYADDERPKSLQQCELMCEFATGRLREAAELLPESGDCVEVKSLVEKVLQDPSVPWPIEELRNCFLPFLMERRKLRLDELDRQAAAIAMEEAGAQWLERLNTNSGAVAAVARLQQYAGVNGQGSLRQHPVQFRAALPIVPVWITTALSTRSVPLEPELFDIVVIDEASQCTLTNLLPMLFRARRVVIIGDPQQLPAIPSIQAGEERVLAAQYDVHEHVPRFGHVRRDVYTVACEALPRGAADVLMLNEHYRSDPLIIGFANRHVYHHRLRLRRPPSNRLDRRISGVRGIHVAGSAARVPGGSWKNELEAQKVVACVRALHRRGVSLDAVGVVTPFAAQKKMLDQLLTNAGLVVTVETAYGYQGDECDIMVFSPVVSTNMQVGTINWVEQPPNLLNVALTRARDALWVVGNLDVLGLRSGLLRDLARYVRDIEALRAGDPAELALLSWMVMEGWTPAVRPSIGQETATFALHGRSGVRIAVLVRPLSYFESAKTEGERAREVNLKAVGYRVVEVISRDVLETPQAVLQRIRSEIEAHPV